MSLPSQQIKRTELAKWLSSQGYESIEPMDYYRFMFPSGELATRAVDPKAPEANVEWKYNGIIIENTHKTKDVLRTKTKKNKNGEKEVVAQCKSQKEIWNSHIVLDDLQKIQDVVNQFGNTDSEFYIAPNSYLGRTRTMATERRVYACVVEVDHPRTDIVDGHREQLGMKQLIHDWTKSSVPYLMPSACVCSGTGLHLVYFLDRPYNLTDNYQKQQWDNFRKKFTKRIWTKYVTKAAVQYENHCQAFRVVGTRSKKNHLVEAFWLSKKRYTIDELFSQVKYDEKPVWRSLDEYLSKAKDFENGLYEPDELMKAIETYMPKKEKVISQKMLEAKEKWPEWYQKRIVEKRPRKKAGEWTSHRGLYDWYLRSAKEGASEGCRYNRVHGLAAMAVKCDIPFEEFNRDAFELYKILKLIDAEDEFRYIEFVKARDEYFSPITRRSTRKWIETAARIPVGLPAKRNGRKKDDHINRVNQIRLFKRDVLGEDEYANCGRPDGSGTKQDIVQQWRQEHPDGRKIDCERDTGLSRHTILKWWDVC